MAVGKPKFPLEQISGVLGKKDRSVGKEPGLGLNISDSNGKSILGLKTAATKTRSPGQIERSAAYCFCDEEWKKLSPEKTAYCQTFHTKVRRLSYYHMTNYLCWMSLCMSAAWSATAFRLNSYITRYAIKNTTGETWTDHKVSLTGINTKLETGTDITVLQTTFYRQPLQTLNHKIDTPGTAIICLPEIAPSDTIYIDVYSYGTYSTPQNCSCISIAEIDEQVLTKTTMKGWLAADQRVEISWTPPKTGVLYWFYKNRWVSLTPPNLNISSSIGPQTVIGKLPGHYYGYYVYAYRMGIVEKDVLVTMSGLTTDPGAEETDCGCPSMISYDEPSYSGTPPGGRVMLSPGSWGCCAGGPRIKDGLLVEYPTYTQITPESIIKIGPT